MSGPPAPVVEGFGGRGPPVRLPGGRGTSWRAGGVVLKPLDTSREDLAWQEGLLAGLGGRGDVRVAAPRRHAGGGLVADGWTARPWLAGEPATGDWRAVAEAGRRFASAVAGAARPAHLAARRDPWAVGERVAWDEAGDGVPEPLRELAALRRPVDLPAQVVHGDLTGNVLRHPGAAAAVIDLSACWRPVAWGTAVVVADALLHHGAGAGLAGELLPGADGGQLLVRAVLCRGVTDVVASGRLGSGDWARAVEVAAARARG